jgi:hypothetical protein
MKKYIVYDDYEIGYIKDICKCEKCQERGRAEVFINDLDDNYLDCIKANDFENIIYLGDSLKEAINELNNSFKSKIQTLEKEKLYLQKLVDLYSELKDEHKEFIIRVAPNTQMKTIIQYGSVKLDAKLWRDEYIFKTKLNFEDVSSLPFVLSVKSL